MHILLIVFRLPMHLLLIQLLHFSIFLKPCQFGYDCNWIKRKNFFKKEITSQHFLESCCCNCWKIKDWFFYFILISFFKVDFVRKEKNDDMGFLWQVVSIKLLPPDDLLTNLTEGLHYYTYHTTYDTQKKNR